MVAITPTAMPTLAPVLIKPVDNVCALTPASGSFGRLGDCSCGGVGDVAGDACGGAGNEGGNDGGCGANGGGGNEGGKSGATSAVTIASGRPRIAAAL